MRIELPVTMPEHIQERWEGQFSLFSPYTFLIDVPAPVFIVTTLKENGLANASLSTWGMMAGNGKEPKFILQVHNYSDTRRLIERNGEFVVNYPSLALRKEFCNTWEKFDGDTDEILASGLGHEPSAVVKPPRVAECFACLECRVEWMRDVEAETRTSTLVQAAIVHAAIDDSVLGESLKDSHMRRQWAMSIPGYINPVNGAFEVGAFAALDMERSSNLV